MIGGKSEVGQFHHVQHEILKEQRENLCVFFFVIESRLNSMESVRPVKIPRCLLESVQLLMINRCVYCIEFKYMKRIRRVSEWEIDRQDSKNYRWFWYSFIECNPWQILRLYTCLICAHWSAMNLANSLQAARIRSLHS